MNQVQSEQNLRGMFFVTPYYCPTISGIDRATILQRFDTFQIKPRSLYCSQLLGGRDHDAFDGFYYMLDLVLLEICTINIAEKMHFILKMLPLVLIFNFMHCLQRGGKQAVKRLLILALTLPSLHLQILPSSVQVKLKFSPIEN